MTRPGIRNSMSRLNGLINTRKSRSSRVLFPPILILATVIICFGACQERKLVTKDLGHGSLVDRGKGSYYPRFVVEVNPCPVGEGNSCAWTLDGLPSSEYTVQVILEAISLDSGSAVVKEVERTTLIDSGLFVSVAFRDPSSGEILHAFAGEFPKDWIPAMSDGQYYFRSPDLEDLPLSGKTDVLIVGSIENPGRLNDQLSIRIRLRGGGKGF